MRSILRPLPFVIAATNHGTMIVNRHDYHMPDENSGYGVGYQLLNTANFDLDEIELVLTLLERKKQYRAEGIVAIDCGANIGVHTIEWAKLMYGWGEVIAFEAQEKIYYALAGNIAINNCLNVTARHCAVGAECSTIEIPEPNYYVPASYGSLELKKKKTNEFIGQNIDYTKTRPVALISIDSLELPRVDFIKIDVEGMEEDVLKGAQKTIKRYSPAMLIEIIKSDKQQIEKNLTDLGYECYPFGINILAVHTTDPLHSFIKPTSINSQ